MDTSITEHTLQIGSTALYTIGEISKGKFRLYLGTVQDGQIVGNYQSFGDASTDAVRHADEQRAKAAKPRLEKLLDALVRAAFEDGADYVMAVECASGGSYIETEDAHTAAAKERADLLDFLLQGSPDEFGLPTIPGQYRDADGNEGWTLADGLWWYEKDSLHAANRTPKRMHSDGTREGWLPLTRVVD